MNLLSEQIQKLKLKNNVIDFVIASLLILSLYLAIDAKSKTIWIVFSIILFLRIATNWKMLLYVLLILTFALIINLLSSQHIHSGHISGNFKVKSVMTSGVVIDYQGDNVFVKTKLKLSLYDKIYISGNISKFKNFSTFDYVTYMKSKNIFNQIPFGYVKVLTHSEDIRSKALDYLSNGPGNYPKVAPLMLLGKKTTESKPIYDEAFSMSVIHLFVISGFHISLFFVGFKKVINLLGWKDKSSELFCLIPIFTYLYLLDFPLSASRASMLILFSVLNRVFLKGKLKSINLLSCVMILMFLWNRNSIYSVSFVFTFIATFVIICINGIKFKKIWTKYISILLGAYISNLPITIYLNGFFSIFGIIYSSILSPVFVFMYGISIVLFPFKNIMSFVYGTFISLLDLLNSANVLINVKNSNLIITQSLYLIPLLYLIINRKWNLFEDKKAI